MLATTFVFSEWEEFQFRVIPVAIVLVITGAYLVSRHRAIALLYYLLVSVIIFTNIRLIKAGEWVHAAFPAGRGKHDVFVPESRIAISCFGTLALDLAVLLALAAPFLAPYVRRWIRRLFRRGKEEPPASAAAVGPKGLRGRPIVRKAWFPLTAVAVWSLLMFGNPQWCRAIYIYQGLVSGWSLKPPAHYTGPWKAYSLFGTVAEEGQFRDGLRQGTWFTYGWRQRWAEDFKDGIRDGTYTLWNDRGIKSMEYHYKNGITDGPCWAWHRDGTPFMEFTDKAGVHDGPYRQWDEDGRPLSDCVFKDGKVWEGVRTLGTWDRDGHCGDSMETRDTYRHGVKDGPAKAWVEGYGKPKEVFAEGEWRGGRPWEGTVLTFADPAHDNYNYWIRTYHEGKADGPARLYVSDSEYADPGPSRIEGGVQTILGPNGAFLVVVAEGRFRQIEQGDRSRIVPDGPWQFRDHVKPEVTVEGVFRDGRPWSGTIPRRDSLGRIADQCRFQDGTPWEGTYYEMPDPAGGLVLKTNYWDGQADGPPITLDAEGMSLPLYLRD
jgi:antitoxin component YwqK of YwqJK toxin-antitoxin module